MVGYESNIKKDFAHGSATRTSSPRVSPQIRGDFGGARGASPPQVAGSTQTPHRVYVHILPSVDRSPTLRVEHRVEEYYPYVSVKSRLNKLKFEQDFAIKKRLNEVKRELNYVRKRLERCSSSEECAQLKERLNTLLTESKKLLDLLNKRDILYIDDFLFDVPPSYLELLRELGLDMNDATCDIFVSVADAHVEFDGARSCTYRVVYVDELHARLLHPAWGVSKGKRAAFRILRDSLVLSEVLKGVMLSAHRKRNHVEFTRVETLPVRALVLTMPKELSSFLFSAFKRGVVDDVSKLVRDAAARAVKRFALWRLAREGVELRERDAVITFALNVHLVGDTDPFTPHLHAHILFYLIVYDKRSKLVYRLNPLFDTQDIDSLRLFWKEAVRELVADLDVPTELFAQTWNIYVDNRYFNLFADSDFFELLHTMRYNARRQHYDVVKYLRSHELPAKYDADFVRYLLDYSNQTTRYGLLTNVERYARVFARERVRLELEEIDERLRMLRDELHYTRSSERANILAEIRALNEKKKRLLNLLEDESEALSHVLSHVSERLHKFEDKLGLLAMQIARALNSFVSNRVLRVELNVIRERVPLMAYLSEKRAVFVLNAHMRSFALLGFFDPFSEPPP